MARDRSTPGPWWLEDRRNMPANAGGGGVLILGEHRGEGSGFCIASLNHKFEIGSVLPNARLLAAAPELRDALKGLLGLIQLLRGRDDLPGEIRPLLDELHPRCNHRITDANAVLAKCSATALSPEDKA